MTNKIVLNNINDLVTYNDNTILKNILALNEMTSKRNLYLQEKDIIQIIETKNISLKELGRVEIKNNILERIIYEFYDSPYIDQTNYLETILDLTRIFYLYQNELNYKLTDEEIIIYLQDEFNNNCGGDLTLLETLSLSNLKEALEGKRNHE